jgi:N-formylglutamate amidohydrolase
MMTPYAVSTTAEMSTNSDPARFDVAAPGTGMGLFDQATERRIDEPSIRRIVGVHQLFRVPVHLGATLRATQLRG